MAGLTRRAVLAALGALGAGSILGLAHLRPRVFGPPSTAIRLTDGGGFMGAGHMDMSRYMEMFHAAQRIDRIVEVIPGDLTAQLQEHVSSIYAHLDQQTEIRCMSQSLPKLFRRAGGYRWQLTFTPIGVIAEETADVPALTDVIRAHAGEVTGFVRDGMPAMMQQMRMMPPQALRPTALEGWGFVVWRCGAGLGGLGR